ncbi:hypothetical protein ACFVYT_24815 [Streptomyces sp. NPDC058290]|uniref:hypothetical protein n=1 Tax=Streptomyces sp. NPDC058290 TaxID=3346426 RepID=UPI0036E59010
MNESTSCQVCTRELWEDELGRFACRPCEQRLHRRLVEFAGPRGLYARLCLWIEPGARSAGPRVTGSTGAPVPTDLSVLDMTADGGLIGILEDWVEDWASRGLGVIGESGRLQHRVDQAIATLVRNLPQACHRHPALDAFAAEINSWTRRCEAIVEGGRPPVQFKITCPCSRTIRFGIDTPAITCPGCETGYSIEDIRRLAAGQRTAA